MKRASFAPVSPEYDRVIESDRRILRAVATKANAISSRSSGRDGLVPVDSTEPEMVCARAANS